MDTLGELPEVRRPSDSREWDDQWRHRLYEALDALEQIHWEYTISDDSLQVAWARARRAVLDEIHEVVEGAERAWRRLYPTYGLPHVARRTRQVLDETDHYEEDD